MTEQVQSESPSIAGGIKFSEAQENILPLLFEAKQKIGLEAVAKNATNDYHGSRYADINAVLERVEPVLNGLGIMSMSWVDCCASAGTVAVHTRLTHMESREFIERSMIFVPANLSPQAVASCESYGRRYNHSGFFNLRSADDDGQAGQGDLPNGNGGSAPAKVKPATDKQKSLIEKLAAERNLDVPEGTLDDTKQASAFIDGVFSGEITGTQAGTSAPQGEDKPALSQTAQTASDYIAGVDVSELGKTRKLVENHKQLSADEKKILLAQIAQRDPAAKAS